MRSFYIFLLTIFISISSYAQTAYREDVKPYGFKTKLKGGYTIAFTVDDSLQYLYLRKGEKTIIKLASTSKGLSYKNLGFVGADFNAYFALIHAFGSGNPHYVELIKKSTGKNVISEGAALFDADTNKGFILYSENDVPSLNSTMTLYDIVNGKKQFFSFPNEIFDDQQILNRIQISSLDDNQLVIKYEIGKGLKTKVYRR